MYVDLGSEWFQDDLQRSEVDAKLLSATIQKLLAKSFHNPRIHGHRGARRGIIRRVGPFSELEIHYCVGVVGVETTIM